MSKTMASGLILVYFPFKGPGDCCGQKAIKINLEHQYKDIHVPKATASYQHTSLHITRK